MVQSQAGRYFTYRAMGYPMGVLKTLAIAAIGFVVVIAIVNGVGAPATSSAPSALPQTNNAAGKADAQARYHSCVSSVETNYSGSWANACNDLEVQSSWQRNDCMARGLGWDVCSTLTIRDGSPDCKLPVSLASELNAVLEKGRDRCLQEVTAGLR
jgi:hypothetical protein